MLLFVRYSCLVLILTLKHEVLMTKTCNLR